MKVRRVVFLVPLALLTMSLLLGSSLLLRLFYLAALVPLLGLFWTLAQARGLAGKVEPPPDHCQAGESFEHSFAIDNTSNIPKFWMKAEETSDIPGHQNSSIIN